MPADKDDVWDSRLFDASDVTYDFPRTSKRNEVLVRLRAESGQMNLLKTYFALKMLCEKIENDLNILEEAAGEH
jgi:hypothetical protein